MLNNRELMMECEHLEGKVQSVQSTKDDDINGVSLHRVVVSKEVAREISKPQGSYSTLLFNENIGASLKARTKEELAEYIKGKDISKVLLIGVGNENIKSDSFGVLCSKFTSKRTQNLENLMIFIPSVSGLTNIDSKLLCELVIKCIKPTLVIVCDSLLTNNIDRLNRSLQISDASFVIEVEHESISFGYTTMIKSTAISQDVSREVKLSMSENDVYIEEVSQMVADVICDVLGGAQDGCFDK